MATNEFYKSLRVGLVDITQVSRNFNTLNCMLVNVAFGNYILTHSKDLLNAILEFTLDTDKFEEFMSMNKVCNRDEFEKWGLVKSVDHIAQSIDRIVVIVNTTKGSKCYKEIGYISKNKDNPHFRKKLPLYLLLSEDQSHIAYAFRFQMKPKCKFCLFCMKNVTRSFHHCRLKLCRLCCRHLSGENAINQDLTCSSNTIIDTNIKCKICNNNFTNVSCYEMHKQLRNTRRYCLEYFQCNQCKLYIRNGSNIPHIHNHRFCQRCKIAHSTKDICYITSKHYNKSKISNVYYFLKIAITNEGYAPFAMIKQIVKSDGETIYLSNLYNGNDVDMLTVETSITLDTIMTYLDSLKNAFKSSRTIEIYCDQIILDFMIARICSDDTELLFGRNASVTGFKQRRLYVKSIESFIDSKPHILSYLLGLNMVRANYPTNLTRQKIVDNSYISVRNTDYDKDFYIGSKREQYLRLKVDGSKLRETTGYAKQMFIDCALFQFDIFIKSIEKLLYFYTSITKALDLKTPSIMFQHSSLAQAGNYLFRSLLNDSELPVINDHTKNFVKNSSLIEYCTVELLKKVHLLTCRDGSKITSLITNNGRQYTVGNFSVDFHCGVCKTIYYVNGGYKVDNCEYGHAQKTNSSFYGKSNYRMVNEFKSNMKRFIEMTNNTFSAVVFNECCIRSDKKTSIKKHILDLFVRNKVVSAKIIADRLIREYKGYLADFRHEKYKSIDFRRCVDYPLVSFITPYFRLNKNHNNKTVILKFDMCSAYPNQLKTILLPYRDAGKKYVFDEANDYINSLINTGRHDSVTGFCRALVIPSRNKYTAALPFFAFKNETLQEPVFTLCKACCVTNCNKCAHTDKQRSFYVNTSIESIIFAKTVLNYHVFPTEILVYEQCKNYNQLTTVFNTIEKIRKENPFFKHIGKKITLQALGSFSLDVAKYTKTSSISSYPTLAAHLCDKKSILQNYSFFGDNDRPHCLVETKNIKKQEMFKSAKLNTLIYTSCANKARIKLYTLLMQMVNLGPSISILRVDADAITVSLLKADQIRVESIFKNNEFKLEDSTSTGIVSFKTRSYLSLDADHQMGILKTCGLSLALADRFATMDYIKLAGDYINNRVNTSVSSPRIIDTKLKTTTDYECLNSRPFGETN